MKCSIKKVSEMYETVYRDLYRYALCLMRIRRKPKMR